MAIKFMPSTAKAALPKAMFIVSSALCVYVLGFSTARFNLPPKNGLDAGIERLKFARDWVRHTPPDGLMLISRARTATLYRPAEYSPGLTLFAGARPDRALGAWLADANGNIVHRWNLDWFRLWPNASHVPANKLPQVRPGTDIHGLYMGPDGSLTFNFDGQGMMQVDVCGRPRWRVPVLSHHGLDRDDAGNFWAPAMEIRHNPNPALPNFKPPFTEEEVVEVSPDGKLLRRISILDLMLRNKLQGLLYMHSTDNHSTEETDDILHLNDVDVFPARMAPGAIKPGDVMVSLRNINTILIFDPATLKVSHVISGPFIRQHDPDFIDGWTISILDNNNVGKPQFLGSSRIVQYSLRDGQSRVAFAGSPKVPFYTYVMGKHEQLPNGNILMTEPTRGRAIEVNAKGDLVFEYNNRIDSRLVGVLDEAQRIAPERLPLARIRALAAACPKPAGSPTS